MKTLPPLPPVLQGRTLSDAEYTALRRRSLGALTKGPDDCPTCRGTKTFLNAVDEQIYECNCEEQWLLHILLSDAGIDRRYQEYSWDDTECVEPGALRDAKTYKKVIDNMIHRGNGMLFYGDDKGTGKTLLATLIAKAALGKGHSVFFIKYPDMLDMWADGWTDRGFRDLFERRVRHVDLLVIDDIGRESPNRSTTADAALDSVLRHRVGALMPTIITTNLTLAKLRSRYSENIASLITEGAMQVHMTGADYRPKSLAGSVEEAARNMTRPVTLG